MSSIVLISLLFTAVSSSCFISTTPDRTGAQSSCRKAQTSENSVRPSSFLETLDVLDTLNDARPDRTALLRDMIDSKKEVGSGELFQYNSDFALSIENPGLWDSIQTVAPGVWKVIYAPHMAMLSKLFGGGQLDVTYMLKDDATIESHARIRGFPWMDKDTQCLYLSVSGTYGSESETVCFVHWDQAWVKSVGKGEIEEPYPTFEQVPNSLAKNLITQLGKAMFIRPFSVFPISLLNDELVVFDFELLGTRICARKVSMI